MKAVKLENSCASMMAHEINSCRGQVCSIHNRTDHHLRALEQLWNWDKAIMTRLCNHGEMHPDPDDHKVRKNKDEYPCRCICLCCIPEVCQAGKPVNEKDLKDYGRYVPASSIGKIAIQELQMKLYEVAIMEMDNNGVLTGDFDIQQVMAPSDEQAKMRALFKSTKMKEMAENGADLCFKIRPY